MGGKTRFVFLACAPIMHVKSCLNHARHVHLGGVACTFHDPCWYNVVCGFVVVFLCLLMYKVGFVDMLLVIQCVAIFMYGNHIPTPTSFSTTQPYHMQNNN